MDGFQMILTVLTEQISDETWVPGLDVVVIDLWSALDLVAARRRC